MIKVILISMSLMIFSSLLAWGFGFDIIRITFSLVMLIGTIGALGDKRKKFLLGKIVRLSKSLMRDLEKV